MFFLGKITKHFASSTFKIYLHLEILKSTPGKKLWKTNVRVQRVLFETVGCKVRDFETRGSK